MAEKKRRAKGAGSLRYLDGDRYQVQLKLDGERHTRVFRARNRTEAERESSAVIAALTEDVKRGRTTEDADREERQGWTVEKYLDYYFAKRGPMLADTTRQRYTMVAKHQVIPHIGKKKMAEVTPSDLMRLYARLGEKGANAYTGKPLSSHSIWHVQVFLEALYTFAQREHDFDFNPAKEAKPADPRESRKATPAVDVAEVERFVALASAQKAVYPLVMVPARLGTRRGETIGLRWSDVDFEGRTITVRRSVCQTPAYGVRVKSTKTRQIRTIPLDADTLVELWALQVEQSELRTAHGEGWKGAKAPEHDYILAMPDGALMTPQTYTKAYVRFVTKHGMAHITPHVLRHAFVSQMFALGHDPATIAAMSGHSIAVLLRTYTHAFDARKREAMDALAEARRAARVAL